MKLFNNKTLAEEEVDKIIKEVDHNMSGSVDFTGKLWINFKIDHDF